MTDPIITNMKHEIDARTAIKKLREAQLIVRDVHDRSILVGFKEVDDISRTIQVIKERLFQTLPQGEMCYLGRV